MRRFAAGALGGLGSDAKDAIPALSKALDDKQQHVREAAATALDKMGAEGLQALSKALANAYPDVKEVAIASLGKAGSTGVTPLADMIKDVRESVETRLKAIEAVKGLNKDGKAAVPALDQRGADAQG